MKPLNPPEPPRPPELEPPPNMPPRPPLPEPLPPKMPLNELNIFIIEATRLDIVIVWSAGGAVTLTGLPNDEKVNAPSIFSVIGDVGNLGNFEGSLEIGILGNFMQ